ncbi:MAG: chemotaxis protein CheW [Cyanobacteria bacterium P01_A01_bin.83]
MYTSSAAERVQADLQQLFKAKLASGDAYLKLQLTSDVSTLLPMAWVEESRIVAAEAISPLPNMPSAVIGMTNSRDRVFCIFDLAQLLGLSAGSKAIRQYQIAVLKTTAETPIHVGLSVMELQGIVRVGKEQIQTAHSGIEPNLIQFIVGVATNSETPLPILKFEQVLKKLQANGN